MVHVVADSKPVVVAVAEAMLLPVPRNRRHAGLMANPVWVLSQVRRDSGTAADLPEPLPLLTSLGREPSLK